HIERVGPRRDSWTAPGVLPRAIDPRKTLRLEVVGFIQIGYSGAAQGKGQARESVEAESDATFAGPLDRMIAISVCRHSRGDEHVLEDGATVGERHDRQRGEASKHSHCR